MTVFDRLMIVDRRHPGIALTGLRVSVGAAEAELSPQGALLFAEQLIANAFQQTARNAIVGVPLKLKRVPLPRRSVRG